LFRKPKFLEALAQQIKNRSTEDWKAYLRWWAVHRSARYVIHDFEQTDFEFLAGTF
jgi:predicted metalloendopeptidase